MQLVSYRIHGHVDESWRAGVEHAGLVISVAALWDGGEHETTTRQLLAAGSATIEKVFTQARELLDAGHDGSGVFQTASVELGPQYPIPIKSFVSASIMLSTRKKLG